MHSYFVQVRWHTCEQDDVSQKCSKLQQEMSETDKSMHFVLSLKVVSKLRIEPSKHKPIVKFDLLICLMWRLRWKSTL